MYSAVCPLFSTKRAGWRSSGRLLCQMLSTAPWCGTSVERVTHPKLRSYKSGLYALFLTISQVLMKKAELTTLTLSRIKTLALEVYKALHGHSPPYMKAMFTSRQEQKHSLRDEHQLNIPFSRTVGFGSHSIQFEGARVWNHLPNKIRLKSCIF